MVINGIDFSEEYAKSVTKEQFIKQHLVFLTDKPKEDAEKILTDAYYLLNPPKKVDKKDKGE